MVLEEEIVFKLLCQVDKVGSLIGKGGSIIRSLQHETGASIRIADATLDSDEKVVVISAKENAEQRHSPAQDAVIRVQNRIAEIGFESGAAVVARLLVHPQQIGCLLGKGGIIIGELRRVTGASIRIFPMEHIPKYGSHGDEVVQVIGSLQSVQESLFQITSRLRETIFPPLKPHLSGSPYMAPYQEMPPHPSRPRHDPAFPTYSNCPPYSYGPSFDRHSSPGRWTSQAVGGGNPRGGGDIGGGFGVFNGLTESNNQKASGGGSSSIEIVIPHALLSHVYGEDNSNLDQIKQMTGSKVVVHEARAGGGAGEGLVVVTGSPGQVRAAQTLIQAFILCDQNY